MAKNFVLLQGFYVIPVRELETRLQQDEEVSSLDCDFLSNVAPSIQDVIENRSQEKILDWIDANDSIGTSKIPASKISFSSSTIFNQFLSIHNSTPQIIDRD